MSNPVLQIDGVTRRYGDFVALDTVSIAVDAGLVVGLVGPNGAGKTTLFESVAGVQPRDAGTVRGRPMFYMPDGITPWETDPAGVVLRFFARLHGSDQSNLEQVIERLELGALLSKPVGQLSRGQRKKLLVGMALVTAAEVLLLDEPFDGLDLRQTRHVGEVLRAEATSGRTLFLSIHQLNDAERICDRLVLLSGGRIAGQGTIAELQARTSMPGAGLEEIFLALT